LASTSSAVTSYTDTTASPSVTYRYEVRARDAADNLSLASNPATVTTAPAGAVVFGPEADARVEEANPGGNYGASSNLRVDGGTDPGVESYLRFNVSGISGAVQAANLRVYAYTGTADGPALFGVTDAWSEAGITWANRPPAATAVVDDKGAIATNSWVEYDVTPLVTGPGTYSFVLSSSSTDGVDLYSREGVNPPKLVVSTGLLTANAPASVQTSLATPSMRRPRGRAVPRGWLRRVAPG
jgi:hypothetical protein